MKMKKLFALILCITSLLAVAIFPASAETRRFSDIDTSSWYYQPLTEIVDYEIMVGTGNNKFSPDIAVTRESFVLALYKAINAPLYLRKPEINRPPHYETMSFSDVEPNKWYSDYVEYAYQNGWIAGIGNGKFGVGKNISRQDAAVVLSKFYKNANDPMFENTVHDVDDALSEHPWPYDYVDLTKYKDYDSISAYARNGLKSILTPYLINDNLMYYYEFYPTPPTFKSDYIEPKLPLTRAELVYLLAETISFYKGNFSLPNY
ncbi:MAG: S-layer homology domain-containing protein [Clostridia bacterium]|nr:S-layer homology domain-containing protein [Clostridia bacterium]